MERNNGVLLSLAMDLKRVALAYHRGSDKVAERFLKETTRWMHEIDTSVLPEYINNILNNIDTIRNNEKDKAAEDSLMYSILLQNYSLT